MFLLQISEEDFKPKQICSTCNDKVDSFLQFIELCMSTSMRFESIYYADPYSLTPNEKHLYKALNEHSESHKPSVIVSNRQGIEQDIHYRDLNKDGAIVILDNCHINQPDIINFNVNYSNMQPSELDTLFASNKTLIKTQNEVKLESEDIHHQKSVGQCLVLDRYIPNDLLDNFESEITDNIIQCTRSKNVSNMNVSKPELESNNIQNNYKKNIIKKELISVEDVQKSLFLNNTQKSEPKKVKTYPCPHCEKVFKRRLNLTAHISVHTNIKGYKCLKCPKTFAVKCHLTQHNKTHSELFKCHICQKSFQVPSKLSRHMQTHSTNKPFKCTFALCNKAFSDKYNLKQHILSHSNVKDISCNMCGKLFKSRKNLNAHIKTHVSENVFQCTYCDKNFKYKHNLKTHIVKHGT